MADKIQIGYRVSEKMNTELEALSEEWDTSKNSVISILLKIGLKAYENLTVQAPQEPLPVPPHTRQGTAE